MKININADIGEGFGKYRMGNDEELMRLIGSANIACGMHAGDPTIMVQTIEFAKRENVSIGAHPGFNDIGGFGRRQIRMNPRDLEYSVTYQIGALQAIARSRGARVTHVKPHGALNNMAHDDAEIALAVGRGIKAADPDLIYVANVGSEMTRAGESLGLRVANESYVDRRYDDDGKMLSRELENAVIRSADEASEHVMRILQDGALHSVNGRRIPAEVHTFCIHGDEPTAVPLMSAVRAKFAAQGVEVVSIPEMLGLEA